MEMIFEIHSDLTHSCAGMHERNETISQLYKYIVYIYICCVCIICTDFFLHIQTRPQDMTMGFHRCNNVIKFIYKFFLLVPPRLSAMKVTRPETFFVLDATQNTSIYIYIYYIYKSIYMPIAYCLSVVLCCAQCAVLSWMQYKSNSIQHNLIQAQRHPIQVQDKEKNTVMFSENTFACWMFNMFSNTVLHPRRKTNHTQIVCSWQGCEMVRYYISYNIYIYIYICIYIL